MLDPRCTALAVSGLALSVISIIIGCKMLVVVDDRPMVRESYKGAFVDAGVSVAVFGPAEVSDWIDSATDEDIHSVEGVIVGNVQARENMCRAIRTRVRSPIVILTENPSLEQTLALFAAGVDDVVRKPVHAREILARVGTIKRRMGAQVAVRDDTQGLVVYFDGRDPEIDGAPFTLPRRERRILEFLVSNAGKRVTKSQIFSAIYGLFDDEVDECVVESHISKLRKKLRSRLGFDPIDAKRYLGYQFQKYDVRTHGTKIQKSNRLQETVAA
jgi:DNA-binding response OmpR family regulator